MGWVVSVTPQPRFAPGERTPGTHCTGGWVGPTAGLDTEARGKISCLCRGSNINRPVVHSVARHYTDWATPAPLMIQSINIFTTCVGLIVNNWLKKALLHWVRHEWQLTRESDNSASVLRKHWRALFTHCRYFAALRLNASRKAIIIKKTVFTCGRRWRAQLLLVPRPLRGMNRAWRWTTLFQPASETNVWIRAWNYSLVCAS
jgi:hypothetical protein